jgi:hypothetical protein
MTSGALLNNQNPKTTYTNLIQETLNSQFYNSTDWFTIQEETSVGSGQYQNVDVRINNVVNPTTSDIVEDDFKKLIFTDINHSVNLGRFYYFANNYWITINVDKVNTMVQTAIIRRCNNTLRWMNENTGAVYSEPCSISYLIKENRDYATAGSMVVVPSGMVDCLYQINSKTNQIRPNQRFLFGNQSAWTAYRVEGGGINNFSNQETLNNNSATLGRFSLATDFINVSTDDLVNGIANINENIYVLSLNRSIITGSSPQTIQLTSTVTLNGETVTRGVTWSSSNPLVATVNSVGLVSLVGVGSCTITCTLDGNSSVLDSCSVVVGETPSDIYQVVASPDRNYVLEGSETTWTVYLYENGVQQVNHFVFTLDSNTVPSNHYEYTVLGNNSFKIKNLKRFLTDTLEIAAVSGSHTITLNISLRGAW